jgi:hypothetical protein
MLAAVFFGVASAEGAQFFQPPVAGFLSQGSMVSQAVPVPMIPFAGQELPLQPAPYMVTDVREETSTSAPVVWGLCALAVAGAAMRKPILRANRSIGPAMVSWAEAPPELKWAEAAWNSLQLDAKDLGEACIWIPPGYGPDDTHEWYFCSTQAASESGVSCYSLPMITAGRNVYICSQPKGSRPAYYE